MIVLRVYGDFIKNYEFSDAMLSGCNTSCPFLEGVLLDFYGNGSEETRGPGERGSASPVVRGPIQRNFVEAAANGLRRHSFSIARKYRWCLVSGVGGW